MTAVLSATDPLRRDRVMSSHDDNQINYSPAGAADWKDKYYEAADMLAEARAELDEFQRSSKELEDELERELERTEKTQEELRAKAAKAELERDEWKSKFMHLQTNHNTTTTSLQRELDTLRQDYQRVKVQLRELEMGNDDLERNGRAVTSSLADVEAKYAKVLEEKILLEQELLDKASLEEQCQRYKDEINDANQEVQVLKEQLAAARSHQAAHRSLTGDSVSTTASSQDSSLKPKLQSSEEDILKTTPPEELLLADLISSVPMPGQLSRKSSESSSSLNFGTATARVKTTSNSSSGHSTLLKRAGFPSAWVNGNGSPIPNDRNGMTRSKTVATFSPSRLPTTSFSSHRPPVSQRNISEAMTSSTSSLAGTSKSRGVQMVAEMRARVRNLEQKLHTRVPRLRLGSTSGRNIANASPATAVNSTKFSTVTPETLRFGTKRRSADLEGERKRMPESGERNKNADTSGWVLIMEDSMSSPTPTKVKEGRRLPSPTSSPLSYQATKRIGSGSSESDLGKSRIRRPQSRLSGPSDGRDSTSTVSTTSSIPTPTSRPSTPTFLPIPTSGLYASGIPAGKRSVGPGVKRSSLGSGNSSPTSFLHPPLPVSSSGFSTNKSLPPPPPSSNVTIRASRPPSALGQSRIGRPNSLTTGRKSGGENDLQQVKDNRLRAGSTSAANGRGL